MKNYESACWHGGNSSYLVATRPISTFAPCWIWCQIHFLLENLWTYMKTWLKYVLFGDHHMSFVPHLVEFGVKFRFLLKIYAITWKYGWDTSYLVATKWVLFLNMLILVSNSSFCWKFMQTTWKDGWNTSYLVANRLGFVPQYVEFGFKFSFLLKIYANYMKRLLKYVLFSGHHMCFCFPLHIELSPKLKLKSKIN
jgi:hypothetical protein